jgi:adenosine kinase
LSIQDIFMPTLICGSIAYDNIMVFPDRFRNHLLPDQLHILNVCFLVPEMRREFGGCAGNIAYSLKLLGGEPLIMATVGQDSAPYDERLTALGLAHTHVRRVAETFTAQAFITTDLDDNQITAFHPGAMNHSHANHVGEANGVQLGIVAPDGREGMLQHAREFAEGGIPFVFDPGQGLPMFSGDELLEFLRQAEYLAVNSYEAQLLQEKTGRSMESLAGLVRAAVVTHGAQGSVIYNNDKQIEIPSVTAQELVDPTGCGDAYRAGLLYGIAHGMDWELTGRLGALLGALKIAVRGPQNHQFTRAAIGDCFKREFGITLW